MTKKKENYGIDDISTLEGIEAIRTRGGMYVGSTEQAGVNHITLEIISNSIDEYLNGHCDEIAVSVNSKTREITISDDGRGIPAGIRENGENVLESVFTKLHTGAKFAQDGTTGYNSSGGLNGVGSKATNALSSAFMVLSHRDGKTYTAKFERGRLVDYKERKSKQSSTGTTISFVPDTEIFKDQAYVNTSWLKKTLEELSFLCKGVSITLTVDGEETIYKSEKGLLDYVNHLNKTKSIVETPLYFEFQKGNMKAEVAMLYNSNNSDTVKAYTNNIPNPNGGTHLVGFRTALTTAVNRFARDNAILKDKEDNLSGADLLDGQVLVLNLNMPDPVFDGQTKAKLNSSEGRSFMLEISAVEIKNYFDSNPQDAKTIIEKALLSRRASEAAKKARDAVRNVPGPTRSKIIMPSKLTDATGKDRKACELLILEGNSAAGSAKDARDTKTQGILPIRGKIINAEKTELSKLLQNEEVKSIITALGCGFGETLDLKKMRYGKVVILTDADEDGGHISMLLMTFFLKYMKPLVEEGHLYIAVSPLYRAVRGTSYDYLKDEQALEDYKKKYSKFELFRYKGIGELNPKQLKETTLDPKTRTLKQISVSDLDSAYSLVTGLMGSDSDYRKEYISKNSTKITIEV